MLAVDHRTRIALGSLRADVRLQEKRAEIETRAGNQHAAAWHRRMAAELQQAHDAINDAAAEFGIELGDESQDADQVDA